MKLITIIRTISFLPLAACWAWGQSESPSVDVVQRLYFDGSNALEAPGQKVRTQTLLPEAPSLQPPTQAEKFQAFVEDARSPLNLGAIGINVTLAHEAEEEHFAGGTHTRLVTLYGAAALQKESSFFFGKYLYPSLLGQDPRYHPSTSNSVLGRALYAASRILITRKDSGKRTVNSSYFLGLLTSRVLAQAYRPYWARSNSVRLKSFGSDIGSDIGINLLHEFGPGLRQMMRRHSPKFLQNR